MSPGWKTLLSFWSTWYLRGNLGSLCAFFLSPSPINHQVSNLLFLSFILGDIPVELSCQDVSCLSRSGDIHSTKTETPVVSIIFGRFLYILVSCFLPTHATIRLQCLFVYGHYCFCMSPSRSFAWHACCAHAMSCHQRVVLADTGAVVSAIIGLVCSRTYLKVPSILSIDTSCRTLFRKNRYARALIDNGRDST